MATTPSSTSNDKPNNKLKKLSALEAEIKICIDFYIGAPKVLNLTYLPKWTGETDGGYKVRIASTAFANLFAPVVDGIVGMVMKKEPILNDYANTDNIDLKHNSLTSFMKTVAKKSVAVGISFVSAETNTDENRAYLKEYSYDALYSYVVKDGKLTQIVFKETIEEQDGAFGLIIKERYVVFKIGGGEIWYSDADTNGNASELEMQSEWTNTLKEIPVLPIVTGKVLSDFEVLSKLLDIAVLNKVHLNLESSHANVLGIVGNPVPMFFGLVSEADKDTEGNITIGVKDALVFKDKKTEGAEYLEITGASIGEIQKKISLIEAQIDKLTFSILLNEDSKTVIDAQQKQSKNTSFLSDIANELEAKFTKLLGFMAELENKALPKDAKLEMEKDFDATLIDLEIAFKLLQAGNMSRDAFYNILKTGRLPKDFDIATENEKIESDT